MGARDLGENRLHLAIAGTKLGVQSGHLAQEPLARVVHECDRMQIDTHWTRRLPLPAPIQAYCPESRSREDPFSTIPPATPTPSTYIHPS